MKRLITDPTPSQFVDLVERSGLVDHQTLQGAVNLDGSSGQDAPQVGHALVEAGLITRWQKERLLEGRWRGLVLRKYEILDEIGRGGMGVVYLARHRTLENYVAIKVLPRSRLTRPTALKRFIREAQTAAQLNHPNITRTFDVDSEANTHYLVMEYIEGRVLQEIVREEGPLDFEAAADYTRQVADGLAFAHEHGLTHRDIKPANLMLDKRGNIKILDFGLALVEEDDDASLTMEQEFRGLGTADYIAPEQAMNSHGVDSRADLYSLGQTFYFLLTGQPPFPEGTKVERIIKHCTQSPERIDRVRSGVPAELVGIWTKMTRKKPENRFASAREVSEAFQAWLRGDSSLGLASGLSDSSESDSGYLAGISSLEELSLADDDSHDADESFGGSMSAQFGSAAEPVPSLVDTSDIDDTEHGADTFWDDVLRDVPAGGSHSSGTHAWSDVPGSSASSLAPAMRWDAQRKPKKSKPQTSLRTMSLDELPIWFLITAGGLLGALLVWLAITFSVSFLRHMKIKADTYTERVETLPEGEQGKSISIGRRESE